MADNDQFDEDKDTYKDSYSDEYKFSETDPDMQGDVEPGQYDSTEPVPVREGSNIRRNAVIAVAIVVLAMILYKFLGSWFTKAPQKAKAVAPPVALVKPSPITAAPSVVAPPPVIPDTTNEVRQRVTSLESAFQNANSDISSLSNQVSTISSNISDLSDQIAKLNQMISQLSSQLEQQSDEIAQLKIRMAPKKLVKRVIVRPVVKIIYHVKAIIPGRAWLIAENGSTITVREGSQILGYGIVTLIDPIQGKVLTSSGQVIRFSQLDS